ncbi:PREDICTED: dual serine/threonine and tyrosine protein kinase-like [Branchiostoma belcheri]|uniref:Dual serine/threonine and tyrosine protein kinase-like n=1 Tax=Branchiostoma belcheri TaxID=7741 RepID=A0A6P4YK50_BRABE|nr:PREDICTED: dual serine/threonine and tyrosine protein kinase-like [Branchiostoma belcheri]
MLQSAILRDGGWDFKLKLDDVKGLCQRTAKVVQDVPICEVQEEVGNILLSETKKRKLDQLLANYEVPILVLGRKGCGKSCIINELLGGDYLPEPTTTQTTFRLRFSDDTYVSLQDSEGKEIYSRVKPESEKPKALKCTISKEIKENSTQAQSTPGSALTVEVGLNYPGLSKVKIVESPALDNQASTDIFVNEYLANEFDSPVVVYVIDGNDGVKLQDRYNIRKVQEALRPASRHVESNMLCVCNKIDVDKDQEELNTAEDEEEEGASSTQQVDKAAKVYEDLKSYGYFATDLSVLNFYKISAKNMLRERKREEKTRKKSKAPTKSQKLATGKEDQEKERFLSSIVDRTKLLADQKLAEALATMIVDQNHCLSMLSLHQFDMINKCGKDSAIGRRCAVAMTKLEETYGQLNSLLNEEFVLSAIRNAIVTAANHENCDCATFERIQTDTIITESSFDIVLQLMLMSHTSRVRDTLSKTLTQQLPSHATTAVIAGFSKSLSPVYTAFDEELSQNVCEVVIENTLSVISKAFGVAMIEESFLSVGARGLSSLVRDIWGAFERQLSSLSLEVSRVQSLALEQLNAEFVRKRRSLEQVKQFSIEASETFETHQLLGHVRDDVAECYVKARAIHFGLKGCEVSLTDEIARGGRTVTRECTTKGWGSIGTVVTKVLERQRLIDGEWERAHSALFLASYVLDNGRTQHLTAVYGWLMPDPNTLHVVTERAEMDLVTALRRRVALLPVDKRRDIALDVARGLQGLHDLGFVFGDLKPRNVLLFPGLVAKINIAKSPRPFSPTTETGTPFHLSPYVYRAHGLSDVRADIYAFGMLLWFLWDARCRRPAVYANCRDNQAMEQAVCNGVRPDRPAESNDLCWQLMQQCWNIEDSKICANDVVETLLSDTLATSCNVPS